jgi:3-phenylpropionate/trans-cinnamate dioxygenase ferredoxin subunit
MMVWHDVASAESFEPDTPKVLEVGDVRIAVFQLDDGFYAISDICTHEYALLSEGFCEGGKVECPLHQACFDIRTGRALDDPAEIDLQTYPTRVLDGLVQVDLG